MGNSAVALLRNTNIYCWHVWLKGLLVCYYCLQKLHNTWFVICCILTFLGGIWYESVFLSTLKDDTTICSPFLLTLVYLSFLLSFILFPCHLFILQMEALTINFQVNKIGLCFFFFSFLLASFVSLWLAAFILLRIRQVWFSWCVALFLLLIQTNYLWVLLWKCGSLILGHHSSLQSTTQLKQRLYCFSPLITMAMPELSQQVFLHACCSRSSADPVNPPVWTYPSQRSPWRVNAHMPHLRNDETDELILMTMFNLSGIIIWLLWEKSHPQSFKN